MYTYIYYLYIFTCILFYKPYTKIIMKYFHISEISIQTCPANLMWSVNITTNMIYY